MTEGVALRESAIVKRETLKFAVSRLPFADVRRAGVCRLPTKALVTANDI